MAPAIGSKRETSPSVGGMARIEPDGIGMPWPGEDFGDRSDLDDAASIQHRDPVGHFCDYAKIVRNEHDGDPGLQMQVAQELQNVSLHRYVQRSGRLIGNDQRWPGTKRQRDDDALPHPAGQLVRVLGEAALRLGDADSVDPRHRAPTCFAPVDRQVRDHRVDELAADGQHGIQARQWILKYEADLAPSNQSHCSRRNFIDALARKGDGASGSPKRRDEEIDDCGSGQGLARAGLADEPKHLAGLNREADRVQGREVFGTALQHHSEVAHLQQRACRHRRNLRRGLNMSRR